MMFATSVGLITFEEEQNSWAVVTPENSALPREDIAAIVEGRNGRILISTGGGVVVLDP